MFYSCADEHAIYVRQRRRWRRRTLLNGGKWRSRRMELRGSVWQPHIIRDVDLGLLLLCYYSAGRWKVCVCRVWGMGYIVNSMMMAIVYISIGGRAGSEAAVAEGFD